MGFAEEWRRGGRVAKVARLVPLQGGIFSRKIFAFVRTSRSLCFVFEEVWVVEPQHGHGEGFSRKTPFLVMASPCRPCCADDLTECLSAPWRQSNEERCRCIDKRNGTKIRSVTGKAWKCFEIGRTRRLVLMFASELPACRQRCFSLASIGQSPGDRLQSIVACR